MTVSINKDRGFSSSVNMGSVHLHACVDYVSDESEAVSVSEAREIESKENLKTEDP